MIFNQDNNSIEVFNIGRLDNIKDKYLPIIQEVEAFSSKELGVNFESFYIRGSISSGKDTKFSDLDIVIVTKRGVSKKQEIRFFMYSEYLQNKYKFVNGFELATISFNKLIKDKNYFNLRVNLKTNSVLIAGKDIRIFLPRVILNRQFSKRMFDYAYSEYVDLKKYFLSNKEKSYLGKSRDSSFWCSWIMRVLSRSGMGILMLNEKEYTNDIRYISKKMAKRYPQFEPLFIQAAKWVVEPTPDKKEVKGFLNKHVDVYFKFWKKLLN